jgi:hypothetical protein
MKVTSSGGADYPKAPEGLHKAVCVDVIDRGLCDYSYQGVAKGKRREVSFVFQLEAFDEETGEEVRRNDGKRHTVSTKFTASLGQNARLVPFLEQWLGKTIPPEVRASGFELEELIGRNAQITVIHAEKEGKTYANIKGILPIPKKDAKLAPEGYTRVRDRDDYEPPFGSEDWERLQSQAKGPGREPGEEVDDDDDDDSPLPF